MAANEQELLGKLGQNSPLQSSVLEHEWERLRLMFDLNDPIEKRSIVARGVRSWRKLPTGQKGSGIRLLSGMAIYYNLERDNTRLKRLITRLQQASSRTGLVSLHAEALLAEGLGHLGAGEPKEAVAALELSKALFTSTKSNDFDVVRSSILLADAFRMSGDLPSAAAILERARALCLELEEIPLLASVSQTLGLMYFEKGDLNSAIRSFEFARTSSRHMGFQKRELRANLALTISFLRRGSFEEARLLAKESLLAAEHLQLSREICLAHEFIGAIESQLGNLASALWHYSQVHKKLISNSIGCDIAIELQRHLSELWLKLANPSRAFFHRDKGLALAHTGGEKEDQLALKRLGFEISWVQHKEEKIIEGLSGHAEEARALGYGYEHLVASRSLVVFADELNKPDLAAEWWARVEFLAKSCGAEPLLERWRKERQEKGYLPQTSPDGLDGEPGPNARLAQELPRVDLGAYNIITRSRQLYEQAASVGQVAQTTVPVLIHGESGTGKELFAKLVHDLSPRKSDAFLAVNCGALPSELLESELFGHRRGSFTGAINDKPGLFRAAHKGTLFLDEIGEMTAPAQTKLLRVLEAGELRRVGDTQVEFVDVRIVAATNVDLEREVKSGKFRQDLYYRLKGLEVFLPPLRERMSDIPLLADYFLNRANQLCHKQLVLPFETKQWLMGLPWHGNVRELRLAVERATALGPQTGMLQPYHFMGAEQAPSKSSLNAELEEIERSRVLHALDACKWNKAAAAKLLGMSRTTLGGKIKRLGIDDLDSRD